MKLPNDLIKATDYSKAKNRIIHEFKCVNGKVIQHYALGGEHELTIQEIIDCLNALSTIDCDLQTAYAYIESQQEKISDLEAKLAESEKESKARYSAWQEEIGESDRLRVVLTEVRKQLAEKENEHELLINQFEEETENLRKQIKRESDARKRFVEEVKKLKQQLEKKEYAINNYWQSEKNKKEMFREENKKLREQLAEKEEEIEELNKFMSDKADEIEDLKERISNKITSAYGAELMARDTQWHLEKEIHELQQLQNQTAIAELEKAKEFAIKNKFAVSDYHNLDLAELNYGLCLETLCKQINNQINVLRNNKDGIH